MNTKKTVYNKLFKEETQLAKHEVELALVDDIKKYTTELNKLFTEASNTEDKLDTLIKQLFPLLNSADSIVNKIKDVQDKSSAAQIKFVQAIKEVGLNPSESKENMALFDIKDSIETRSERIISMLSNFK